MAAWSKESSLASRKQCCWLDLAELEEKYQNILDNMRVHPPPCGDGIIRNCIIYNKIQGFQFLRRWMPNPQMWKAIEARLFTILIQCRVASDWESYAKEAAGNKWRKSLWWKLGCNVTEISPATRRRRSEEKIQNKIKFWVILQNEPVRLASWEIVKANEDNTLLCGI